MKNTRTLTIAVVENTDQAHDSVARFLGSRHKKNFEHLLFIYNIADEPLEGSKFMEDVSSLFHAPHVLIVADGLDLLTRRLHRKDYKTAFADAMHIAQQFAGVESELPNFYNFFQKPKDNMYTEYKRLTQ